MHPSAVQFGLSRGLLQLRGDEVLLSDQLLETVSLEAKAHLELGKPPIRGTSWWISPFAPLRTRWEVKIKAGAKEWFRFDPGDVLEEDAEGLGRRLRRGRHAAAR